MKLSLCLEPDASPQQLPWAKNCAQYPKVDHETGANNDEAESKQLASAASLRNVELPGTMMFSYSKQRRGRLAARQRADGPGWGHARGKDMGNNRSEQNATSHKLIRLEEVRNILGEGKVLKTLQLAWSPL